MGCKGQGVEIALYPIRQKIANAPQGRFMNRFSILENP